MTPTKASPSPRLADPALLEKIDKLFAYNIGEYISLPQLVVVGEQSSGKSSVLEGLTKMAFPRDSGLCTRYATQILFRRNLQMTDRKITASIVPGPDTAPERERLLRGWHANDLQTLDARSFTQMMAEVGSNQALIKRIGANSIGTKFDGPISNCG
jgi:GTPase SAR1 family protein